MLNEKITQISHNPSDINEHINTLIKYGRECEHITEMGVRWIVSTWAFLYAKPKELHSYDILPPSNWGCDINEVYNVAKANNVKFNFYLKDVTKISIVPTDLLFIDTWHVYDQLKTELNLHSHNVKKYIILHDTETFKYKGESENYKGLWFAIEEFLNSNKSWTIHEHYSNNNGLTILKRL